MLDSVLSMKSVYLGIGGGGVGKKMGGRVYSGPGTVLNMFEALTDAVAGVGRIGAGTGLGIDGLVDALRFVYGTRRSLTDLRECDVLDRVSNLACAGCLPIGCGTCGRGPVIRFLGTNLAFTSALLTACIATSLPGLYNFSRILIICLIENVIIKYTTTFVFINVHVYVHASGQLVNLCHSSSLK